MLIREFQLRFKQDIPEPVLQAGEYLEKHGEIFSVTFGEANAIDKAAEMMCILLDEDLPDWRRVRDDCRAFGEWVEWR